MKIALSTPVEAGVFLGIALAAHIAFFAAAPEEGATSSGSGGDALVSISAADPQVAEMVDRWQSAPQVASMDPQPALPDPAPAPVPEAPAAPQISLPTMPALPDQPKLQELAAAQPPAQPDRLPEPDTTAPPPPPAPPAAKPLPAVAPKARPKVVPPRVARSDRQAKRGDRNREASAGSAGQVAAGSGGGQNAGDGGTAAAASAEGGRLSDLRMGWGAVIRARIERDKSYPDAADGAAGRVMVRLTVGRDGGLRALSLIRSSGNGALDQAALQAVRAASPYPAAPDGLSQPNYTFNLPMTFGS